MTGLKKHVSLIANIYWFLTWFSVTVVGLYLMKNQLDFSTTCGIIALIFANNMGAIRK